MSDNTIMNKVFEKIYRDLMAYAKSGKTKFIPFNMPYSPASSWSQDTQLLFLTLNPKKQTDDPETYPLPEKIFPDQHDFFKEEAFPRRNNFHRAMGDIIRALPQHCRQINGKPVSVEDYARHHMAMWSVIPFRTTNEDAIRKSMKEYTFNAIWPGIFDIWLPPRIAILGKSTFEAMVDVLRQKFPFLFLESHEEFIYREETHCKKMRRVKVRWVDFEASNGRKTVAVGLPHCSYATWLPFYGRGLEDKATKISPIEKFLRRKFAE